MPAPLPDMCVRIKRDGPQGPSRPVLVVDMTDSELDALDDLMARHPAWQTWTWVKACARYIRDHGSLSSTEERPEREVNHEPHPGGRTAPTPLRSSYEHPNLGI
jgi:hypothetical protein